MLIPELDKLRDKTLSFGCVIKIVTAGIRMQPANIYYTRLISEGYKNINSEKVDVYTLSNIGFQKMGVGRKGEGKPDERTMRIKDGNVFGLSIHSGKIIGKPLTRGRIEYLYNYLVRYKDSVDIKYCYDKIFCLFADKFELFDKTELERHQSPHWEELKELLIQFSNYL